MIRNTAVMMSLFLFSLAMTSDVDAQNLRRENDIAKYEVELYMAAVYGYTAPLPPPYLYPDDTPRLRNPLSPGYVPYRAYSRPEVEWTRDSGWRSRDDGK